MNVTATTLPRRAASVTSRAVLGGQGEVGRRPDRRQPLLVLLVLGLMRERQRRPRQQPERDDQQRAHGSRLQLALELVEEAPVGAVGDELVRAGLDHADLVQAERVEAQRCPPGRTRAIA